MESAQNYKKECPHGGEKREGEKGRGKRERERERERGRERKKYNYSNSGHHSYTTLT